MESKKEIINDSNSLPIKLFLHRLKNITKHCHPSIEILFLLSGDISMMVEDQEYQLLEDDLIVINPNQLHELQSTDCVMLVLQLAPELLVDELAFVKEMTFNCNSSLDTDKSAFQNLKILISKLVKVNTEKGEFVQMRIRALLYDLLYELSTHFKDSTISKSSHSQKQQDRISRIIHHINTHFYEDITLSNVAATEFLSLSYLSRYFEKNMGQTFKSFLSSVRLTHAFNDLLSLPLSIDEIAEKNGFPNSRAFVAAFKEKYNELPSVYRKNNALNVSAAKFVDSKKTNFAEIEQSNYLSKLTDYLKEDIQQPYTTPQEITIQNVNAIDFRKPILSLENAYIPMISFGKFKDLLQKNQQDMLQETQKDLQFQYIAFHDFFSTEMQDFFSSSDETLIFDFDYMDRILDFITALHLKPVIKLGFAYKHSQLISELIRNPYLLSRILKKWNYLLSTTLKHLHQRYGITALRTWFFILQEEQDSEKLHISENNEYRYSQFYINTYRTIKGVDPQLLFGPSSLMPYMLNEKSLIDNFNVFYRKNNCPPDFICYKYFPVIIEETATEFTSNKRLQLSEDPNSMNLFIKDFKKRHEEMGPEKITYLLTEWNSTISNKDLLNDTCFKSAYIVKNVLENYEELAQFGYWMLSDANSMFPTGKELFHGGLGLMTKNGIKKPAYYAFWLIRKLGDQLLARGDGYFVTKKDDTLQIMLYNYQHYSNLYASGETFDMTFLDRYTPFTNTHTIRYNFTVSFLENGTYNVHEYAINRQHGSCFDTWTNMFQDDPQTNEEIDMLKAHSQPLLTQYKMEVSSKHGHLSTEVAPLEVKLLVIKRR